MTTSTARVDRRPLVVLGIAQFLMVLDSAVMNVSVGQLVEDFDTEVTAIQAVITFYSLVMAASMMTGGKLGDRLGRRRAFRLGLVIYGVGSSLTAVAWSVPVLMFGWSVLEGLGAALVLPAMAALVAGTYEGRDRATAYAVLGGLSGVGVAVGPILGGYFTAELSWRYVFVGEALIVVFLVWASRWLADSPPDPAAQIDVVGAILSASGLALVVGALLQTSSWGWVEPRNPPVEPLGLSPFPFVAGAGAFLLWGFVLWSNRRVERGETPLVRLSLLRIDQLRSGLNVLLIQNTVMLGVFFTLPLYLQLTQGLDAFESGVRLLPMSVMMLVASIGGARLGTVASARTLVRIGLAVAFLAALLVAGAVDAKLEDGRFAVAMAVLGSAVGLLASQLGNVIQSAVGDQDRSEAGGLQYTWQNLGSAIGTALAGSILIGMLTTAFLAQIGDDPELAAAIPAEVRTEIQAGVPFVAAVEVEAAAEDLGLAPDEVAALVDDYGTAQLQGLRAAIVLMSFLALLGLFLTGPLPSTRDQRGPRGPRTD